MTGMELLVTVNAIATCALAYFLLVEIKSHAKTQDALIILFEAITESVEKTKKGKDNE